MTYHPATPTTRSTVYQVDHATTADHELGAPLPSKHAPLRFPVVGAFH